MSPLLLLSLLFLEATADDGSGFYAKSFVDVFKNAIEFKNEDYLNETISADFTFFGCKNNYRKPEILTMLSTIPPDTPVSVTFKSSKYVIKDKRIQYYVDVKGVGVSLELIFQIVVNNGGQWKVITGGVRNCQRPRFRVLSNSADDIA